MARVFIDTNFLLLPFHDGIDIFSQIQSAVPDKVSYAVVDLTRRELEGIMAGGSLKDRMAARLGLTFVTELHKQGKLAIIRTLLAKDADAALLKKAGKSDYVATQDKELKEKLKRQGVKVLTLRGHHVVVEHK